MSKHTPGPWVISNNSAFLIRAGDADTGRHIAQVGPANYHPSFAVDEPNARLIAAAPDLLEALEKAAAYIEGLESFTGKNLEVAGWHLNGATEPLDKFFEDNSTGDELSMALAAIAKARGEP